MTFSKDLTLTRVWIVYTSSLFTLVRVTSFIFRVFKTYLREWPAGRKTGVGIGRRFLSRQVNLLGRKIRWGVHFLENTGHPLLCILLKTLALHLTSWNLSLLITLLQLFVGQKVCCHDTIDFLEVFKDCKPCILDVLFRRTELTVRATHIKGHRGRGPANNASKSTRFH